MLASYFALLLKVIVKVRLPSLRISAFCGTGLQVPGYGVGLIRCSFRNILVFENVGAILIIHFSACICQINNNLCLSYFGFRAILVGLGVEVTVYGFEGYGCLVLIATPSSFASRL